VNASGMDQPPEGTVATNNASRRAFLKGVGLAAAAGLTAPFLATSSAHAGGGPLVLGINAPEPWEGSPPAGELPASGTWSYKVPGAIGCRSYRDNPFKDAADCPSSFPGVTSVPDGSGGQKRLPTKVVASIRPDPTNLLQGRFDTVLTNFIVDGMKKAKAGDIISPQLTVWHEAGNLYLVKTNKAGDTGWTWGDFDLTPQTVRQMHVYMQNLCNRAADHNSTLPRVEYGSIVYGEISKMDPYVPYDPYSLDWYGIDVYYEDDANWGRGNLVDYTAVANYMDNFLNNLVRPRNVTNRVSNPKINVCECNANFDNADARPGFFQNLAAWLNGYPGGRRMLTFFPVGGGPHSVEWGPPKQSTIDALNVIQQAYG
jgi:hypothetical protein